MARVKTINERNKELALQGLVIKRYALKVRANPTSAQQTYFGQAIGCSRFTYNFYLNEKKEVYQNTGKTLDYTTFKKSFNQLKTHPYFSWLATPDKFALENSMMDVDTAFKNFFEGRTQFPKFKSKHSSKQSYTTNFTNNNIRLDIEKRIIRLPKAGDVSVRMNKEQRELFTHFQGRITAATVSRHSSGQYYISLSVEDIVSLNTKGAVNEIPLDQVVGCDLGLTHFLITSDGEKIENPRYLKEKLDQLARLQRQLKNKKVGSANYKKLQKEISKLHLHIANSRRDFLHKQSRKLVNENQVIVLEDLNVKGLIKNKRLSRSIADVGWGIFKTFVSYKAEWANKRVVLVNRFFASSKICHGCKEKNILLSLNDREWVCPSCGETHDRDENAAKNIKEEGLRILQSDLQPSA
jgi:putative transposase